MKSIQDVKNTFVNTFTKIYDNSLEFVSLSLANTLNSNLRNLIIKRGLNPDKSPRNAYMDLLSPVSEALMPSKALVEYMHNKIKNGVPSDASFRRTERKVDEGIPPLQVAKITLPEILEKDQVKVTVKEAKLTTNKKRPPKSKKVRILKAKAKK